jgi:phosphatidate phosphatase APP1
MNSTPPSAAPPFAPKKPSRWLQLLRVTNAPLVKVYRSYGSAACFLVHGHAFRLSPLPRRRYRKNFWTNFFALLRLFFVRPAANVPLRVCWNGQEVQTETDRDGYFRVEFVPQGTVTPGQCRVEVTWLSRTPEPYAIAQGRGTVFVPHPTHYACISDIDDTFLVSHSSNLRKRLWVLFTENARSRDPFEGVLAHYQLLAQAGTRPDLPNAFFFVSSSEWNLYDYIREFSEVNDFPEGVYLLSQLKRFHQLLKTGQNKHLTKFNRITRILKAYPNQKFILLGDDTQEDPNIYASVIDHFPGLIHCVYLRQVNPKNRERTRQFVEKMQAAGVETCYFAHSAEAMEHSRRILTVTG